MRKCLELNAKEFDLNNFQIVPKCIHKYIIMQTFESLFDIWFNSRDETVIHRDWSGYGQILEINIFLIFFLSSFFLLFNSWVHKPGYLLHSKHSFNLNVG